MKFKIPYILFAFITFFHKLNAQDVGINILASNYSICQGDSGLIQIDICNHDPGTGNLPLNTIRPQISLPSGLTAATLKVVSAPGYSVISNNGSTIIFENIFSISPGNCNQIVIQFTGVSVGGPQTVSATLGFVGTQTIGNIVENDNSTSSILVKMPTTSITNLSVCSSALPFLWNGLIFNSAGMKTAHLMNSMGCDSAATLNLAVNTLTTSINSVTICSNQLPYIWNGVNRTATGTYTYSTTSSAGCDSLATLNLVVNPISTSTDNITICSNQVPYIWNSTSYYLAGTYTKQFTNALGCDSTAILLLSIVPSTTSTSSVIICDSLLPYLWNGTSYNSAGTYVKHFVNSVGCDSSATLILSVTNCTVNCIKPKVSFNYQYYGNCLTYNFKSSSLTSSGWITSYNWDFGNAQTSSDSISLVTFSTSGVYDVKLVVTTNMGCKDSLILPINIINQCTNSPSICSANWWSEPATGICDSSAKFQVSSPVLGSTYDWNFGDSTLGTGNPVVHKYLKTGNFLVRLLVKNGTCQDSLSYNIYVSDCSVTSPSGLESKSLGDVIAVRLFGNAKNNKTNIDGINTGIQFKNSDVVLDGVNEITLSGLLPNTLIGVNSASVSTPTDLVNFTNAADVLAVNYSYNNQLKAVVFGTKTYTDIYNHTKPICDRLKGAELLEVKIINVKGYRIMAYKVLQRTGQIEFAMNLSAGISKSRSTITLQSNWFTDSYIQDDILFNFQLWAVSYEMVSNLANDIIQKLQSNAQVDAITSTDLPKAYITKGNRKGTNLSVTIQNNTSTINGFFELKEKSNETSTIITRQLPFTLTANGKTNINIPVNDRYESNIYMYLNNNLSDLVYLSDGTWSVDFDDKTTIQEFKVVNDNISNTIDECRLFRNVKVKAISRDYVSVYKTMMGGGLEQNLSKYRGLVFHNQSQGAKSVTVTLVKKSIVDWNKQFSYTIDLDGDREYSIELNQFKSGVIDQLMTPADAFDIVAVNFAYNVSRSGLSNALSFTLSNLRFTELFKPTISLNDMSIVETSPNPNSGLFKVYFTTSTIQNVRISVLEAATGRQVITPIKTTAKKGLNICSINLENMANGNYLVMIDGDESHYTPAKVILIK